MREKERKKEKLRKKKCKARDGIELFPVDA